MSDVDVEIKCLSCRKDEPDSGALTKHFFSSKQSKLKVNSDLFFSSLFFKSVLICFLFIQEFKKEHRMFLDDIPRPMYHVVGTPFSYLILVVVCHLDYIQFNNLLGGTTRSLQDQVFQKGR